MSRFTDLFQEPVSSVQLPETKLEKVKVEKVDEKPNLTAKTPNNKSKL